MAQEFPHIQADAARYRALTPEDAREQAKRLTYLGLQAYAREASLEVSEVDGRKTTEKSFVYIDDNDAPHREDGPAVIGTYGSQEWYRHGERHREDGPAVIHADDGKQEWWVNGERHREDGPAIIEADGEQRWYRNGRLHREDGPAIIEADGRQQWYRNGGLHRDDGPAVIHANGSQAWYRDGRLHREDGPAIAREDDRLSRPRLHVPTVIFADDGHLWRWNGAQMSKDAIRLRTGHPFTVGELTEFALSDDEAEREGALRYPDCPEHVRAFIRVAI